MPFRPQGPESPQEEMSRAYNNSVRYTDEFVQALVGELKKRAQGPVQLLMTSDHGEETGHEGRWGHLMLFEEQYQVPLLYLFLGEGQVLAPALAQENRFFSHLELGNLLAYLLGYNQSPLAPTAEMFVLGTDLDGLAGYLRLKIEGQSALVVERQ